VRPASVVASFSVIVLAHGWGFWHSGGEAKRAISNGPIRGLRTAPRTLLSSSKVEQGLANTGLRNGRADVMSFCQTTPSRPSGCLPFIVTPEGRARPGKHKFPESSRRSSRHRTLSIVSYCVKQVGVVCAAYPSWREAGNSERS
jgi:hypothetical protein